MRLGLKEMKKNKARFLIVGVIVFLVSLSILIITGLSNGLSQDNASLIKDLPDGKIYMANDAEENYSFSRIDQSLQQQLMSSDQDAVAFSIQMGFVNDQIEKQHSVAFVATGQLSPWFEEVKQGDVILDSSLKEEGVKVGDVLTQKQLDRELVVRGFVEQKKFNHAPVAFIHQDDYETMYQTSDMQLVFTPAKETMNDIPAVTAFSVKEFLQTLPSYKAEQTTLQMIVYFLVVISGMLFAIFFYMMNVQKVGMYGTLKAMGVKTITLFQMMWTQTFFITVTSLILSVSMSQIMSIIVPAGMPYHLPLVATIPMSVAFLFIGFFGATLSGIQIQKVEPLQALQQGEM